VNPHQIDEVIDDVLDGVATPDQAAWLERKLAADSGARARYEDRKMLFQALDPGEMVDPPSDLAWSVMRAVRGEMPAGSKRRGWIASFQDSVARRPALGWAYAIGSVAALVALAFVTITNRTPAQSGGSLPISGTLAPSDEGGPWVQVDESLLEAGESRGRIALLERGASLMATVEAHSSGPVSITVEYDPTLTPATGFDWPRGMERPDLALGRIRFDHNGSANARFRFERPTSGRATIHVTLASGASEARGELHAEGGPRASP
jgi:hypothetical protein